MKLGIVGTSAISKEFAKAALSAGFEIKAVMSRDKLRGEAFLAPFGGGEVYFAAEEMANAELDVIYIASPNTLHYSQSIEAIKGGKHVIVEKPCYMSLKELEHVLEFSAKKQVYVLEAMRGLYSPAIDKVREALEQIGQIRHIYFNWMSYSSQYDDFKAGLPVSRFNKKLGGSALADLGIYLIYAALDLFGMPKSLDCRGTNLKSGVDGVTDVILVYENFTGILAASKVSDSYIDSEIQGESGSILIKPPFLRAEIVLRKNGGIAEIFNGKTINDMQVQAEALYRIIAAQDTERLARARKFMRDSTVVLDACRNLTPKHDPVAFQRL